MGSGLVLLLLATSLSTLEGAAPSKVFGGLLLELLLLSRSSSRRSCCSSFSRALKGLGLRRPKGLMTTADDVGVTGSTELATKVAVPRATAGTVVDGAMLEATTVVVAAAATLAALLLLLLLAAALLKRLWPRLKRLALARTMPRALLPNVGVGCGAELAGVAISVGFTLFLVRVATVVVTRRLVGRKMRPGFLLPISGRMTGVKVLLGREKEIRPRDREDLPSPASSSWSPEDSSLPSSTPSSAAPSPEVRTRSLSLQELKR